MIKPVWLVAAAALGGVAGIESLHFIHQFLGLGSEVALVAVPGVGAVFCAKHGLNTRDRV